MKIVEYNVYFVSTLNIDVLVLYHQGISSYSA